MTTNLRKDQIEEQILVIYMRECYSKMKLEYTDAERQGEYWLMDTFLQTAVNSSNNPEYNFYQQWNNYGNYNDDDWIGVRTILSLISDISKYWMDTQGEGWDISHLPELTTEMVMNTFAYVLVMGKGEEYWETKLHFWDLDDEEEEGEDEEEEEEAKEEYNGSKDFPPNETDEQCPICLEAYTEENQKDGIRTSDIESNCPHCCCVKCWFAIWEQKIQGQEETTINCPICKRDITNWLNETRCVGCGSNKITVFDCGGDKGVNMCNKCFGIPDNEDEDE